MSDPYENNEEPEKPEQEDEQDSSPENKQETLQERSARLEAEIAAQQDKSQTPEPDERAAQETVENGPNSTPADHADENTALKNEIAQTKEQMLRAMAEVENTRKRAVKEREDTKRYAVADFAKDLLEVADNLKRALQAVPEDLIRTEPRLENLVEGIRATERELLRRFEKHGIQKIEPGEEVFNPNYHEVMFETPGTGKPPGTIIQVIETGYILHDRLLRPARVGVAKDDGQGHADPQGPQTSPGGQIDQEV